MDMLIVVGFGEATLRKNGGIIIDGDHANWNVQKCKFDVSAAEEIAAQDPDHDWRIIIHGPFYGETYQRHGKNKWACIEKNNGFA
jgi:hypothetical protein